MQKPDLLLGKVAAPAAERGNIGGMLDSDRFTEETSDLTTIGKTYPTNVGVHPARRKTGIPRLNA